MQNGTLCMISTSGSNFGILVKLQRYPRNIKYIPVVDPPADRLPPLKVRDLRLELEQKLPFFKGILKITLRDPRVKTFKIVSFASHLYNGFYYTYMVLNFQVLFPLSWSVLFIALKKSLSVLSVAEFPSSSISLGVGRSFRSFKSNISRKRLVVA